MERIITNRHGQFIPDPDGTDDSETVSAYILTAAHAIQAMCGDGADLVLRSWCRRYAPWSLPRAADILRPILYAIEGRKWDLSADKAATLLCLNRDDRRAWKIRTIGIVGVTAAQRRKEATSLKLRRDRLSQAAKRRAAGCTPREASIAQTKPWLAAGFKTRRTWERHGKPQSRVANSSRVGTEGTNGYGDETATFAVDGQDRLAAQALTVKMRANPLLANPLPSGALKALEASTSQRDTQSSDEISSVSDWRSDRGTQKGGRRIGKAA